MAGDDWHLVKREIALDNVNVGAANCADAHFYPDLAWPGPRRVHFSVGQRPLLHALLFCQDHRAHSFNISGKLRRDLSRKVISPGAPLRGRHSFRRPESDNMSNVCRGSEKAEVVRTDSK